MRGLLAHATQFPYHTTRYAVLAAFYVSPLVIGRALRKNHNGRIFFAHTVLHKQAATMFQLRLVVVAPLAGAVQEHNQRIFFAGLVAFGQQQPVQKRIFSGNEGVFFVARKILRRAGNAGK